MLVDTEKFTVDGREVESTYVGKARKCCCGCAGKHSTPEEDPEQARRVLGMLAGASAEQMDRDNDIAACEIGKLQFIAYFKTAPQHGEAHS